MERPASRGDGYELVDYRCYRCWRSMDICMSTIPFTWDRRNKYPFQVPLIWGSLTGVEAIFAAGLYLVLPLLPSFYVSLLSRSRYLAIDAYVLFSVALTIAIW